MLRRIMVVQSPRPEYLYPLFCPLNSLTGVGSKTHSALRALVGGDLVRDVLFHLPTGVLDQRPQQYTALNTHLGQRIVLVGRIIEHIPPSGGMGKMRPHRVVVEHLQQCFSVVFFNRNPDSLAKMLPLGEQRVLGGLLHAGYYGAEMRNPELVAELYRPLTPFAPVYALAAGVFAGSLQRIIQHALNTLKPCPEWLPPALVQQLSLPTFNEALRAIHTPTSMATAEPTHPARMRLAADWLYARHVAALRLRKNLREQRGFVVQATQILQPQAVAALPYQLNTDQQQAIAAIVADMASGHRMFRLLLGDVGAGKTIVAFMAMLAAAEAGYQAALMAPTDILARQHYAALQHLCAPLGVSCALLTGRERGKGVHATIAAGRVQLVIGTHALAEPSAQFAKLGLAVIDEQHRFGVEKRFAFANKGPAHLLQMSATPIPRTLALMAPNTDLFGDTGSGGGVSILRQKPVGRQPIATRTIDIARADEVMQAIARQVQQGTQAYWVCPLIDESVNADGEVLPATNVQQRFALLQQQLGASVGLLHGRMSNADKDAAAEAFRDGTIKVLVATCLIEVGLHVPQATIMVIENAERFGLAQLHQLRGRVGRGSEASSCLLLYRAPLGAIATERLSMLRTCDNGFELADADLRLRGPGDVAGLRQSGLPDLGPVDFVAHAQLAAQVHLFANEHYLDPTADALLHAMSDMNAQGTLADCAA